MPAVKNIGQTCPVCDPTGRKGDVTHRALIPYIGKGGVVVEPHTYGVCFDCFKKQFLEANGLTYEAHLESKKQK